MPSHRVFVAALVALWAVGAAGPARADCDVEGADNAAVAAARHAIDADCPCASAVGRNTYRRCALDVVRAREAALQIAKRCRRETLRHAKLSICGRPGAAVCCRVRADGRTRHEVVSDAARCVAAAGSTVCLSTAQSVPVGCDASGCLVAECGDGLIEGDEECEPPLVSDCDAICRRLPCFPPPSACGNGTIDPGEACEPPGVGGCFRDCQLAPCAMPGPGELDIACISGTTTSVGAAATASSYLLGWNGPHRRFEYDVIVRRFDPDGLPLDAAASAVSEQACFASHGGPAIASDGGRFYAVWSAFGTVPDFGAAFQAMYGRRVDAGGGVGLLDELAFNISIGSCQFGLFGPTMAAGISPDRFALGWNEGVACFPGGLIFQDPVAGIRDFNPSPPPTPSIPVGYGSFEPPPGAYSASAASVASLGPDTLWVWHALTAESVEGPFTYFVASTWTDASGSVGPTALTGRRQAIGRPAVAAGTTSFFVAWSQRATDTATVDTEIRAVRATRTSGSLDPDGGLLLATAPVRVSSGPDVAFDGTRWLVVWTEQSGAMNDLRAVAVEQDGTVVDASSRLVAANVHGQEPAVASTGDGRVLVVYGRPDGAASAVRATLVTP
jgi:hypothetical protein